MQMVQSLTELRKIFPLFKEEGFSITIETDFLDVTFNLATKKYFPFQKANNTPLYIKVFSSHRPTIIKQFPKMIKKRILDLSCKTSAGRIRQSLIYLRINTKG